MKTFITTLFIIAVLTGIVGIYLCVHLNKKEALKQPEIMQVDSLHSQITIDNLCIDCTNTSPNDLTWLRDIKIGGKNSNDSIITVPPTITATYNIDPIISIDDTYDDGKYTVEQYKKGMLSYIDSIGNVQGWRSIKGNFR